MIHRALVLCKILPLVLLLFLLPASAHAAETCAMDVTLKIEIGGFHLGLTSFADADGIWTVSFDLEVEAGVVGPTAFQVARTLSFGRLSIPCTPAG